MEWIRGDGEGVANLISLYNQRGDSELESMIKGISGRSLGKIERKVDGVVSLDR
jgi:hypothetical protein